MLNKGMALLCCLAVTGCVQVQTVQRTVDAPLGTKRLPLAQKPPTYKLTHRVDGTELVVQVQEQPRCDSREALLVDRTLLTERTAANQTDRWLWYEYIGAGLLALAGTAFVASADKCGQQDAAKPGEGGGMLTPGMCRGIGFGTLGTGGILLGIGIWDSVKLADTEKRVGKIELPQDAREVDCGQPRGAGGMEVRLDLGGGQVLSAKTDQSGQARIAYAGTALSPKATPGRATVAVGTQSAVVDARPLIPTEQIEAQRTELAQLKMEGCSRRCQTLAAEETAAVNGFCLTLRQTSGQDCDRSDRERFMVDIYRPNLRTTGRVTAPDCWASCGRSAPRAPVLPTATDAADPASPANPEKTHSQADEETLAKQDTQMRRKCGKAQALKLAQRQAKEAILARFTRTARIVTFTYQRCYGPLYTGQAVVEGQNRFGAYIQKPYKWVIALDAKGKLVTVTEPLAGVTVLPYIDEWTGAGGAVGDMVETMGKAIGLPDADRRTYESLAKQLGEK